MGLQVGYALTTASAHAGSPVIGFDMGGGCPHPYRVAYVRLRGKRLITAMDPHETLIRRRAASDAKMDSMHYVMNHFTLEHFLGIFSTFLLMSFLGVHFNLLDVFI